MFQLFIIYNIFFLFRSIESFHLINLNTTEQNFNIDDINFIIINIDNSKNSIDSNINDIMNANVSQTNDIIKNIMKIILNIKIKFQLCQ